MAPTQTVSPDDATATAAIAVTATRRPWWSGMAWWPLLCAPAAVALTLLAHDRGWEPLLHKPNHEFIAIPLLALTVVFMARTWRTRREALFLALTIVSAAFLCREIHFTGSDPLLYLSVNAVAFWVWRRWPDMRATLVTWPARAWLVASFACYFLSQVVARRAFRGLAGEDAVHVPLEELLESVAHLLFLYAAWCSGDRTAPESDPTG